METSLYIHIPFCKKKCFYCDFYSVVNYNSIIDKYLSAIEKEIQLYSEKYDPKINSIYIGGGTPSVLNRNQIKSIFHTINKNFKIKPNIEITIEVNPESIDENFIETIKEVGVNRISVGIQSLNDKILKTVGRIADKKMNLKALSLISKIGLNNWSVDMIYGLPYQNIEIFKSDLEEILKFHPKHISLYLLHISKNTKMFEIYKKNPTIFPTDEDITEIYHFANHYLEKNQYKRYEISNFSFSGYESRHNLAYWNKKDYIGIGTSSVSTIKNRRWKNVSNLNRYIELVDKNELPIEKTINLSKQEAIREFIMLQLRLVSGLNTKKLYDKYKFDIWKERKNELERLNSSGFIKTDNNHITLTVKGILVSNSVISELI